MKLLTLVNFKHFLLSCPTVPFSPSPLISRSTKLAGYLDDLSSELYSPDANPNPEEESREATKMDKSNIANYGVGDWSSFVDFEEFDGGDGQMGVAGDGTCRLNLLLCKTVL